MRAMLLMLLLSCGDRDPADTTTIAPDGDTAATADTAPPAPTSESDCTNGLDDDGDGAADCADSDCVCLETDCTDGLDDDLDGLLDCEDDDCVDICVEDCANSTDDDLDGAVDCDDDECYGVGDCGGTYELTLRHDEIAMIWAWDAPTSGDSEYYRYPFVTLLQSTIEVSASPVGDWGGSAFRCTGYMGASVGFTHGDAIGGRYVGPAAAPGYLLDFSPQTTDGSLQWYTDEGACPISAIPTARLAFWLYQDSVYRYDSSGAVYAQYVPDSVEEYAAELSSGETFMVRELQNIQATVSPRWIGIYD